MNLTGAGILIIELYHGENCIVLFRMHNGQYNETGGLIEKDETPMEAACRECNEETSNLLNLKITDLQYYIVVDKYIAYVVYVSGLSKKDYLHNRKLMFECHHHWRETNDMVRIPLHSIILERLPVIDIPGRRIILRQRTAKVIKCASGYLNIVLANEPIRLEKNILIKPHLKCLEGTSVFASVKHKTAIFIAPVDQSLFPKVCLEYYGGIHITICGFSYNQPVSKLSNIVFHWKPRKSETRISGNKIYIKSKTLDNLATKLHERGFHKIIKSNEWHVNVSSKVIDEVYKKIFDVQWHIVPYHLYHGV